MAGDSFIRQDTLKRRSVPASWVVVPHGAKLWAFDRFKDQQGSLQLKLVDNVHLKSNTASTQFTNKTVSFIKRLPAPMSSAFSWLASSQFYNTIYSLHIGLQDGTVEVTQGNDRSGKRFRVPVPALCFCHFCSPLVLGGHGFSSAWPVQVFS